MMKEVKVRVNLNTGKSTVIQERIIAEDIHGTDAYCEHIIELLEENNLFSAPVDDFWQTQFIVS